MGTADLGGVGTGRVIGRWELGPGLALHGRSTIHRAREIGATGDGDRLAELHPIPDGVDPAAMVGELRQVSRISDPGLLTILDVGLTDVEDQTALYLITSSWTETLGDGPLADEELLTISRSAAGGLAALHRAGMAHGAVHRLAVRLGPQGWLLAPAGLARLIEAETAPYRPPGLGVVEPISSASDMWSLGVVLHEQGAGHVLRPGEPPRLPAAPRTTALLGTLLQADPSNRPTAAQVARGVETITPADPTDPIHEPAVAIHRPASKAKRSRLVPLVTALGAVALVAIGVIGWFALASPDDAGTAIETNASGQAEDIVNTETEIDTGPVDEGTANEGTADEGSADAATDGGPDVEDDTNRMGLVGLGALVEGDCIEANLGAGLIDTVERVECDEPHDAEVVAMIDPADQLADGEQYPGRAALSEAADTACRDRFESYTGASALQTSLTVFVLPPSFLEWDSGERRASICMARMFDGSRLQRSVEGAALAYRLADGSPAPIGKLFGGICFIIDNQAGLLDGTGRQQVVTLTACTGLHTLEVLLVTAPDLEEDELAADTLGLDASAKIRETTPQLCDEFWDGLNPPAGIAEPELLFIGPDETDWVLGDRLVTCIGRWEEPILGSVIFHDFSTTQGDG